MHRSNTVPLVPRWLVLTLASLPYLLSGFAFAAPLALGPVEEFDHKSGTVTVLGQTFRVEDLALTAGGAIPLTRSDLRVGQLLWVDGSVDTGGIDKVTAVYALSEDDVPGDTQLYVAGVVSKVSDAGTLTVGRLRVDFSALLASGAISVGRGDYVEVYGTQPISGGVLLAQDLNVAAGIVGTGKQGIVGTGTLGIVGTGTQGIVGTGTLGIVGTGTQGIVGTGTLGIVGTGIQGIVGTGIQ